MIGHPLVLALIKISILMAGVLLGAAYFVLLERRVAAWVQDRRGPNRTGPFGLLQPIADGIKMIIKEEYSPAHVDLRLFLLAPAVTMIAALAVYAVIPFGSMIPAIPSWGIDEPVSLVAAPGVDVGLVYIFALSSIAVYGVILGGWASNSKYSFLGGLRSSAQMIAYELPLGLGILGVIAATGSMRLDVIMDQQASSGMWFCLLQPLGFLVFVVASFAEAARLPFDLPECEQELVGGYHTEYSGMKLVLFLTAEFIHMITASFLIVILFLGGWHFWGITGGPESTVTWGLALLRIAVLMAKIVAVIFFFMLVRWSWPRFRFDQLMTLAWKVMLPMGIVNLVAVAVVTEMQEGAWLSGRFVGTAGTLAAFVMGWLVLAVCWGIVAKIGPLVTDNRPQRLFSPGIDPQADGNP